MKRRWLEEYTDNLQKMDDLIRKRRKLPKASDLVRGSDEMHPYTQHAVTISGADRQEADRIDREVAKLRRMCEAAEQFVDAAKPAKTQTILRLRYLEGESWTLIGRRIGKGEDAVRKRAVRYLEAAFPPCEKGEENTEEK